MNPEDPLPSDPAASPSRSPARQWVASLLILAASAQLLGITLRCPSLLEANDISRWCTVWALLERGTYAIDDCPWQGRTQDKVFKPSTLEPPAPDAPLLKRLEFTLAPPGMKRPAGQTDPQERFFSSKPPLLPTIVAALLYPARKLSGVPLDASIEIPRWPERNFQKEIPGQPGKYSFETEKDRPPFKFPVYVYYFKPILILLNVFPYALFLIFFTRYLDHAAANDFTFFFSLTAAAFGTYLFAFSQTLNNHTVAAVCCAFASLALLSLYDHAAAPRARDAAAAGFFAALCACNEIPAAAFTLLVFLLVLARAPRLALTAFLPAAALPTLAFLTTQFLAFGQFKLAYEEFGTRSYNYEGSYWNTPLEMDFFNKEPEPWPVYLFHMTFGHHGIFSLTPLALFGIAGAAYLAAKGSPGQKRVAWLALALIPLMLAFYTWNPKARNYGGSTQGLRWLFWTIPLWLFCLPAAVAPAASRKTLRLLAYAALAVSILSVGFALRHPWSHPWLTDLLERLRLYHLWH